MTIARSLRFLIPLALLSGGCAKTFIPNSDVENTSANMKVVLFCERYRHALEEKDVPELIKMMSVSYFEDGGNTTGDDDADFDQVKDFLSGDFLKANGIRYEIRYRKITFTPKHHIHVDFTYAGAFKIPGAKGDEWNHRVSDNRLDLIEDGDSFKIVQGL